MKKRLIAAALFLGMLISMLPAPAMAAAKTALLAEATAQNGEFSVKFRSSRTEYNVYRAPGESLSLTLTPKYADTKLSAKIDDKSVTIKSGQPISVGAGAAQLVVTAKYGTSKKVYTFTFKDVTEKYFHIKDVALSYAQDMGFVKTRYSYTVNYSSLTELVNFSCQTWSKTSKISSMKLNGTKTDGKNMVLNMGRNVLKVKVKNILGQTKSYKFYLVRGGKAGFSAYDAAVAESQLKKIFRANMQKYYKISAPKLPAGERAWSLAYINRSKVLALRKTIMSDMDKAMAAVKSYASRCNIALNTSSYYPKWSIIGVAVTGNKKKFYASYIPLTISASFNGTSISASFKAGGKLLKYTELMTTDQVESNNITSAVTYLNTFFSGKAKAKTYDAPKVSGHLKAHDLVAPLDYGRVRKTWMAARDGGKRYHAGTDIILRSGEKIYSCTPGTVKAVGYERLGGNFVVIEDKYGYQYHYYHMVKKTDFLKKGDKVSAGQLIGHVGNTGNSSTPHLHISILAPTGVYINPYPYMYELLG